jgi:hypothetical protein
MVFIFSFIYFFFLAGLVFELRALFLQASAPPFEPHLQSIFALIILEGGGLLTRACLGALGPEFNPPVPSKQTNKQKSQKTTLQNPDISWMKKLKRWSYHIDWSHPHAVSSQAHMAGWQMWKESRKLKA